MTCDKMVIIIYNPKEHKRKSNRLKDYDYSQGGYYFITICTYDKKCIFGNIINDKMVLNNLGRVAEKEWQKTASMRNNVELKEFVIMPNHIHAIIVIKDVEGISSYALTDKFRSPTKTLGAIIRGYKSSVTKQINILRNIKGMPIWQRNYYEHIIRNTQELEKIQEYIINNQLKWSEDRCFA